MYKLDKLSPTSVNSSIMNVQGDDGKKGWASATCATIMPLCHCDSPGRDCALHHALLSHLIQISLIVTQERKCRANTIFRTTSEKKQQSLRLCTFQLSRSLLGIHFLLRKMMLCYILATSRMKYVLEVLVISGIQLAGSSTP